VNIFVTHREFGDVYNCVKFDVDVFNYFEAAEVRSSGSPIGKLNALTALACVTALLCETFLEYFSHNVSMKVLCSSLLMHLYWC
jgi:hypothetical protein